MGVNFSDFDVTATILEALRSDDETDIDDTDTDTDSGGETTTGTSSETVDY